MTGAPARAALALAAAFVVANAAKATWFGATIAGAWPRLAVYKALFAVGALVPLWFVLLRARRRVWAATFYALQLIYCTVQLLHHWALDTHLRTGQAIALLVEGFALVRHAAVPWDARLVLLIADLPLLALVLWRHEALRARLLTAARLRRAAAAVALLFAAMLGVFQLHGETLAYLLRHRYAGEALVVQRYGALVSNAVDLWAWSDEARLERRFVYGPPRASGGSPGGPAPVLWIEVEGLGANLPGTRHRGALVTPWLTALADRSVHYPYTLAYHRAGGTSDCEFTVLNGVEPLSAFPAFKLRNYAYPNALARVLTAQGYEVLAFHGNFASYFNRDVAYARMGYTAFLDRAALGLPEVGWGATDRALFDAVLARMRAAARPALYHVITMSSHEPFHYARAYHDDPRFDDAPSRVVADYFHAMSYVDAELERFVVAARRIAPRLTVVLHGDHTPFVIRPADGYRICAPRIDGRRVEFVPLYVLRPDGATHHEARRAATFLDVGPTLLEATGMPYRIRTHGVDLLRPPLAAGAAPFAGQRLDRERLYRAAAATR